MFGDLGDAIVLVWRFMIGIIFISVPLAIWKLVDIAIWLWRHIHIALAVVLVACLAGCSWPPTQKKTVVIAGDLWMLDLGVNMSEGGYPLPNVKTLTGDGALISHKEGDGDVLIYQEQAGWFYSTIQQRRIYGIGRYGGLKMTLTPSSDTKVDSGSIRSLDKIEITFSGNDKSDSVSNGDSGK